MSWFWTIQLNRTPSKPIFSGWIHNPSISVREGKPKCQTETADSVVEKKCSVSEGTRSRTNQLHSITRLFDI